MLDFIGGKFTESDWQFPFVGDERNTLGQQVAVDRARKKSQNLYTWTEWDDETGFYYYGARYYDPQLGRFLQPDSIIPDPNDPQSYNRYSYVLNNPLFYTDPTGNFGENNIFDSGISLNIDAIFNRVQKEQRLELKLTRDFSTGFDDFDPFLSSPDSLSLTSSYDNDFQRRGNPMGPPIGISPSEEDIAALKLTRPYSKRQIAQFLPCHFGAIC